MRSMLTKGWEKWKSNWFAFAHDKTSLQNMVMWVLIMPAGNRGSADELMESNEEAQKILFRRSGGWRLVCRWLSIKAPCGRRPSRLWKTIHATKETRSKAVSQSVQQVLIRTSDRGQWLPLSRSSKEELKSWTIRNLHKPHYTTIKLN
jgi:hypothetical protein